MCAYMGNSQNRDYNTENMATDRSEDQACTGEEEGEGRERGGGGLGDASMSETAAM